MLERLNPIVNALFYRILLPSNKRIIADTMVSASCLNWTREYRWYERLSPYHLVRYVFSSLERTIEFVRNGDNIRLWSQLTIRVMVICGVGSDGVWSFWWIAMKLVFVFTCVIHIDLFADHFHLFMFAMLVIFLIPVTRNWFHEHSIDCIPLAPEFYRYKFQ